MNSSHLPFAVRATAAALAVFMTTAMLTGVISIAEPQRSQLMARNAACQVVQVASVPRQAVVVAQASASPVDR
jgi:hypothetical protein